ncbi:MAG: FAD-dependent thymidylate synthase, partial [Acidimicrobiia bacterium]
MYYVGETFNPAERQVLDRHFTNLDSPVFALVDLPEVVKGALFARYSRSPKSLRRLFLDEFAGDLAEGPTGSIGESDRPGWAAPALGRAEALYDRVLGEYGDDSVAQLGGVHLACEQASNLLTKILERGRLMAYLEQSTRYLAYDSRLGGRYRYWRDPAVLDSPLGARYVGDLDGLFDTYGALLVSVADWVKRTYPKAPGDSDLVHRRAVKARALDAVRGILPAASLSNVGVYGSGQAYEALILRMRASALPEARAYAGLMLEELRKVIPSFLRRLDRPERGGA